MTDISSGGFGQPWGVTRTWTNRLGFGLTSQVGNGWSISELPSILQASDTIVEIASGRGARYFDFNPGGSDTSSTNPMFKARFYLPDTLHYDAANNEYRMADASGNVVVFNGFGEDNSNPAPLGGFMKFIDAAGNETTASYTVAGAGSTRQHYQLHTVTRSGQGVTETWTYTYAPFNPAYLDAPDRLTGVKLERSGGASDGLVRSVSYDYYSTGDTWGGDGDLKFATITDATGAVVGQQYYRYQAGNLILAIGTAGIARTQFANSRQSLVAMTEDALAPYADFVLSYNADGSVASQSVQGRGASSAPSTATSAFSPSLSAVGTVNYSYNAPPTSDGTQPLNGRTGVNDWKYYVVATRADGTATTTFCNYAGEVMATSVQQSDHGNQWVTYQRFDYSGRLILMAMPSAVSLIQPSYPDLVNSESSNLQLIYNATGLVDHFQYGSANSPDAGYVELTAISQGQGLDQQDWIKQSYVSYTTHSANGVTVVVPEFVSQFKGTSASGPTVRKSRRSTRIPPGTAIGPALSS